MFEAMFKAGTGFEPPRPLTPQEREQAEARQVIERLIPEIGQLKKLLERSPDIEKLLEQAPHLSRGFESIHEQRGHQVLNALFTQAMPLYGVKEPKDFDRDLQEDLAGAFTRWVGRDRERAQAYEFGRSDELIKEFLTAWTKRNIDPFRRAAGAPGARLTTQNAALPGAPRPSGMVPAGTPPPPPANDDEVYDRAFADFAARTAASRTP